ncbi:MAG: DNA alkylation repair protein [Candidatus Cyclobacteriaceae bacterium M2_1C_046]
MKYLADLQKFMDQHRNAENAVSMKKYMKDHFNFLGLKSPERRILLREFINEKGIPSPKDSENIAIGLWSLPYREYQYIGMEMMDRILKETISDDVYAIEYMLEYKQWWDSIDFIATHLVGKLFLQHAHIQEKYFNKWNESDDIWLNRTAILFQLKYKENTNTDLLSTAIVSHNKSEEFFIQKAIGWALREYAKTDPDWAKIFVENNELPNLSQREALKNI